MTRLFNDADNDHDDYDDDNNDVENTNAIDDNDYYNDHPENNYNTGSFEHNLDYVRMVYMDQGKSGTVPEPHHLAAFGYAVHELPVKIYRVFAILGNLQRIKK